MTEVINSNKTIQLKECETDKIYLVVRQQDKALFIGLVTPVVKGQAMSWGILEMYADKFYVSDTKWSLVRPTFNKVLEEVIDHPHWKVWMFNDMLEAMEWILRTTNRL